MSYLISALCKRVMKMAKKKEMVAEEAPKKKTVKKAVKAEPAEAVYIYHTGDDLEQISQFLTGRKYMIYRILQYSGININQLKDGAILKWGV